MELNIPENGGPKMMMRSHIFGNYLVVKSNDNNLEGGSGQDGSDRFTTITHSFYI